MKQKLLLYPFSLFFFLACNSSVFAVSPYQNTSVAIGVKLDIRVLLKGALVGVNSNAAFLMRDDLRSGGYLPDAEPYTGFPRYLHVGADGGNETIIDNTVFSVTGADAIVDWVFVELRNPSSPVQVVATRAALLQRDGDVVDMDGVSSLSFDSMPEGEYFVAVRHRNHLGIMTAEAFQLSSTPVSLDFTNPDFATYGTDAQQKFSDKMVMIGGDFDQNGKVVFLGPNNDIFQLFSTVLSASENTNFATNFIHYAYSNSDFNMDGKSIFTGPNNDKTALVNYTLGDCFLNNHPNCILVEQLPK